jgi:hypothetical protein
MTDEQRKQEAVEEEIEDLEAPAEAQGDVVGGAGLICPHASCHWTEWDPVAAPKAASAEIACRD